jgi:hypothetical protein
MFVREDSRHVCAGVCAECSGFGKFLINRCVFHSDCFRGSVLGKRLRVRGEESAVIVHGSIERPYYGHHLPEPLIHIPSSSQYPVPHSVLYPEGGVGVALPVVSARFLDSGVQ